MTDTSLTYKRIRTHYPTLASLVVFVLIFSSSLFCSPLLFSPAGDTPAFEIIHVAAGGTVSMVPALKGQRVGLPPPSFETIALWVSIAICAASNYYLYRRSQLADFLGFTIFIALLNLLLPAGLENATAPLWQLTLAPALSAGALYFLCRVCEQWPTEQNNGNKAVKRLFCCFKQGAITICLLLLLLTLLPVNAIAFANVVSFLLCVIPLVIAIFFIVNRRARHIQDFLLVAATLASSAVFFLLAMKVAPYPGLLAIPGTLCIALLALCIAMQNRSESLQENHEHLLNVSRLEHRDENLRDSLLKLSRRLSTDKNNHERMLKLLSHDLRSPIASLQTFANIIVEKNGKIPSREITEIAYEIQRTCSLHLELLRNLLSLSNVSATDIRPKRHSLNPETVVMRAWNTIADLANRKQIHFTHTIDTDYYAYIDPNALLTILRNLLTNAIKFSHPHSMIRIHTTKSAADRITIKIEDSGIGISENRLKEVFKDELHSTSGTFGEKGIGIGLKLCLDLAVANDATLMLKSAPGKGTTALLTLPASPPKPDQQEGSVPLSSELPPLDKEAEEATVGRN